jgi:Origin recognition complex (ORC) subunit 5 C-terminus
MRLVMGNSVCDNGVSAMRGSLRERIVDVFWNTLIQSISDSTRNVHDFIRLGRALWPWFAAPLHPLAIRTTLEGVTNKLQLPFSEISRPEHSKQVDGEISNALGTRFHQYLTSLSSGEESLTCMSMDEAGFVLSASNGEKSRLIVGPKPRDQPYLRNCLLLAAFVCQNNKADQDRKVFSTHGNGRRRKQRAKDDIYGGDDEDVAFGTSASGDAATRGEQLRSLRPRPFPLERVFSIFATLVRLNPPKNERAAMLHGDVDGGRDLEALIDSLGSTQLHTDVMELVDSGYLHRASYQGSIRAEQISLSNAKFWCSLTKEEAIEISTHLDIPLEKYLT